MSCAAMDMAKEHGYISLLTLPMRGRGSSNRCVCVSVTTLASATNALKAKVRYQQKALDAGNKVNVGIELEILGSKVMSY